jgi:hypothetical protein
MGIAAGDSAQALRLYMWNTALSESLYGPIQGLEVTLRNKIHRRFTDQFGARWYDDARVGLQYAQRDQVLRAKLSLQHQGKPLDPSRLIAELSFGFWVGLFGRRYETHLWRPHLRQLFTTALLLGRMNETPAMTPSTANGSSSRPIRRQRDSGC